MKKIMTDQMEAGGKNKNQEFNFVESGIAIPVSPSCQHHFTHIPDSKITPELQMLFSVFCQSGYFIAKSEAIIRYQNLSKLQPGFQQFLSSKTRFGFRNNRSRSADLFQHI
jgi:hypothetical protein